jgi:group I intron endonuclease
MAAAPDRMREQLEQLSVEELRMEVYVITCLQTGKRYVGITSRKDRFATHCRNAEMGRKSVLYSAIRKYGPKAFSYEPLCCALCPIDARLLERQFISEFSTKFPNGYNMTDGGDGRCGMPHSQETRELMSAIHRARQSDPELRRRTSEALRKRVITAEHRANLSKALKGNSLSADSRAKISLALTGSRQSPQTIAKRADKQRGRKMPAHCSELLSARWKGISKTPEQRAKIAATLHGRTVNAATRQALLEQARKPKSEETKAKMRAAAIARWERQRACC